MFKRLEKGVFHRLGDKGKSISTYSDNSRRQSYHNSSRDTESCYQSSRSRGTEIASEKHSNKRVSSRRTEALLESKGSAGGHWKSRSKKLRSSIEVAIYPSYRYTRKQIRSLLASAILISQRGPVCQVMSKI
ncbi:hypothetical protein Tco_0306899 [Tanacetum coccineum]